MGILSLTLPLFFLLSCAKVSYLMEQGVGQMNLQQSARANAEVLADPTVAEAEKEKIRQIALYKKFFYEYFARAESDIYSKTTLLGRPAVTYLVVASAHDEIKASEECFPFMGCFPYLGFFKEESAKEYQQVLEEENLVTWRRPVYAYSTLGYLTDNILSSFFHYEGEELAELIFHELFHTIFFIENEIDLNENLANYFAHELVFEYFKLDQVKKAEIIRQTQAEKRLNQLVLTLIAELQQRYQEKKAVAVLTLAQSQEILRRFQEERFIPAVKKFCADENLNEKSCAPLRKEWNNARFAAFLTYEKESMDIAKLREKKGGELKDFYLYLQSRHEQYKSEGKHDLTFTDYLLSES